MSSVSPTARTIAADFQTALIGADLAILSLAPISEAGHGALTFVSDIDRYSEALSAALASGAVVFVPLARTTPRPAAGALLPVENPRAAFAQASAAYFAPKVIPGIAETARVHPGASVDASAHIGEFTVVREGAVIGAGSEVRDHVVIGRNVVIGANALIKSHAVIGEEGFGMEKDADGNNFRIPHLGSVVIGDHVEVGGFTTVCSGTIKPTVVGDYTKIDDHVHIAHNCTLGRNVIVTACAEVSGSVVLEDEVWLGPNSSIIQGVTLGRGSLLGIGAVALKTVPEGEVRVGNPAKPLPPKPSQTPAQ